VYCLYCGFYLPLDGGTGALPGFSPAGRILKFFRISCIISNTNKDIRIKPDLISVFVKKTGGLSFGKHVLTIFSFRFFVSTL
jgi:hypothetical protein